MVAIVMAFGLLACNSKVSTEPIPQPTTEQEKTGTSGVTCDKLVTSFEEIIEPIADQFKITKLDDVTVDDGRICTPVVVSDRSTDKTYHIHIYATQDGDVDVVLMNTERGNRTELNFALLSFYLYKSVGCSEKEAQEFYDYFKLLTEEPAGHMEEDGWAIDVIALSEILTIGYTYGS